MATAQDVKLNIIANNQAGEAIKALTQQLGGMQLGVGQVASAFTGLGAAAAKVTTLLAGGAIFSGSINAFLEEAKEIKTLVNTFGMTSDAAAKFKMQLDITGISVEDYSSMAFKFDKQLKTNESGLNALGVVTRNHNGTLVEQKTLLERAVETMMTYKAGTDRNEVAMRMFGRSASEVFQLQKLNNDTSERAAKLVDALGISMDDVTLKSATKYKQAMAELKKVGEGVIEGIGQELVPGLTVLANKFVDISIEVLPSLNSAINTGGIAFDAFADTVSYSMGQSYALVKDFKDEAATIFGVSLPNDLALFGNASQITAGVIWGAATVIKDGFTTVIESVKELGIIAVTTYDAIYKAAAFGKLGSPSDALSAGVTALRKSQDDYQKAIEKNQEDYTTHLGYATLKPVVSKGDTGKTLGDLDGSGAAHQKKKLAEIEAQRKKEADDIAKENAKAIEWYGRMTESAKGVYEANVKMSDAESYAARLVKIGAINSDQAVDALTNSLLEYRTDLFGTTKETKDSRHELKNFTENLKDASEGIGKIADLFGLNGAGVSSIVDAAGNLTNIGDLAKLKYNGDVGAAQNAMYAQLAQGLGSVIGGKPGEVMSKTAMGALSGSLLGPVGAIAGGLIGLGASIFGGNDAAKEAHRQQAAQDAQTLDQLAASGSIKARQIMAANGYSQSKIADKNSGSFSFLLKANPALSSVFGSDIITSDTLKVLESIAKIDTAIKSLNETSIVKTIDDINWTYKELAATSGLLADAERARMAELIVAITGVTADSVSQMISDAISSNTTGSAGAAFAEKFEDSIALAIRNMAISNLVNTAIMPILQPVMASMVTGLVAGTLSTSEMAAMMQSINIVTDQISPLISTLAEAFSSAGLSSTSATSVSASAYSSYSAYRLASVGIPGFADGGYFGGGLAMVGEAGPELVHISGSSRIYSNNQTSRMLDNSQVVAELKMLREEMRAGQYAIAKSCDKMAKYGAWLEKWEKDGLPQTTTV